MKNTIVRCIIESVGLTHQDLLIKLQANYGSQMNMDEFHKIINELVNKGKIVKVQYIIPPNGHKMKSGALYLPERSVVIVNAQNDRTHFRSQR